MILSTLYRSLTDNWSECLCVYVSVNPLPQAVSFQAETAERDLHQKIQRENADVLKAANLREETMRSLTAHRARSQEERKMLFAMKRVCMICVGVHVWACMDVCMYKCLHHFIYPAGMPEESQNSEQNNLPNTVHVSVTTPTGHAHQAHPLITRTCLQNTGH